MTTGNKPSPSAKSDGRLLAKLCLAFVSLLVIGPIFCEAVLRIGIGLGIEELRKPSLYAHRSTDDYWKLAHQWGVRSPVATARIHPTLGWSFPRTDTNPLGVAQPIPRKTINYADKIVLLFGDSFAAGFGPYLNRALPDDQVVNFGVGGYGTDQILMRMRESHPVFENPSMVVSVLTTDMDRSVLQFRSGQKPYYEIQDGELVKKGLPIAPTIDEYIAQNPLNFHSYLWALASQRIEKARFGGQGRPSVKDQMVTLNTKILERLVKESQGRDSSAIFILFYTERDIRLKTWRGPFILGELERLGAEIVDTRPLLLALAESEGVKLKDLYKSDGHLDRLANEKVAQATAAILINEWTGIESSPE